LPKQFGGNLDNAKQETKDSMMAFDIKTGAEEAQRKFDEKNLEKMPKGPEEVTKYVEIMNIEEENLEE
jgi:hypothetical protein